MKDDEVQLMRGYNLLKNLMKSIQKEDELPTFEQFKVIHKEEQEAAEKFRET